MLSGIGPASQLQAHDIPVVSVLTNPALHAAAVDTYLNEQNGPLTGVGGDIIG